MRINTSPALALSDSGTLASKKSETACNPATAGNALDTSADLGRAEAVAVGAAHEGFGGLRVIGEGEFGFVSEQELAGEAAGLDC